MKRSIILLWVSVSLVLFLLPFASAACNRPPATFPAATTSPPGPYGTIYVESSPAGAYVYLDDEPRGLSPLTISGLWPKSYEVTVRMSGYEPFTTMTTISGATRSVVYCTLVPGNGGSGLVVISSPDKATVFVDGIEKGITPLSLSTPAAGSHTILLRLAGYEDWESAVDIHAGTGQTVSATLNKKAINTDQGVAVSSDPVGASLLLDGLAKGSTPKTLNEIAPGIHILELELTGYQPWKSTITVPENDILDMSVTLEPKPENMPGWIVVSSSPGNASVTVDGNYIGRTPRDGSLTSGAVAAGDHTVILTLPGYRVFTADTRVSANTTSSVIAELVPSSEKGSLSVTSDPAGAEISVDNRSVGISPFNAQDIAAGYHMVTLKKDGFHDYSASFHITAGTTSTVSATLVPVTSSLHSPVSPAAAFGALGIIVLLALRKRG